MPRRFRWANEGEVPPHEHYAAAVLRGATVTYQSKHRNGIVHMVIINGMPMIRVTYGRSEELHTSAVSAFLDLIARYQPTFDIIEPTEDTDDAFTG